MTPLDLIARELAAALLDGPWTPRLMLDRLRAVVGDRPWLAGLVRGIRRHYPDAPGTNLGALARWMLDRRAMRHALRDRVQVIRYPTPSPVMTASRWSVPQIATVRDLATWLDLEVDALEVLADRRGLSRTASDPRRPHYMYRWIDKASGGHRLLEAPRSRLRGVQRRVLDGIFSCIPPHDAAHGFRAGRSILSFAAPHAGCAVVVRADLQAFFTSVFMGRVLGILRTAGYPDDVAWTLAALCTHRTPPHILAGGPERDPVALSRLRAPHLPQGAPTSGALANLAAYRVDVRVAALAAKLGAHYTRYADDLVLSGDRALARAAPTLIARIGAIALEEGFVLNYRKTRVMTSGGRQRITGIVVNDKLSAPREDVERLRAILHNCCTRGPATQNRDGHPDFRAYLRGRVAWVASVDPPKGARLRAVFDQISWDLPR